MVIVGLFEVAEFESIVRITMAPFLVALGPIFARNLGITRQRLSKGLGNVSIMFLVEFYIRIGHFDQKFRNVQILQKAFLGKLIKLFRFGGNGGHGSFQGRQIRISRQNRGATIFGGSEIHFCAKFWRNSKMVGRTIVFPIDFT